MVDFAKLKKSSEALNERITREIEAITSPETEKTEDTRFWKLERDKSGNGSAVIRFLPPCEADGDDALPWVRFWDHGFQGPTGKWYIEKSLTTFGKGHKDPVSEYNTVLWNSTTDDNSPARKQARAQKRRLRYISNILVVSDPAHPENNGKVFLFQYGKKIFDKIMAAWKPEFADEQPVPVFDLWKGANFKLRIRTVDGYPNYEQSVFDTPAPISNDDSKLEQIYRSEYSLAEFVAKDKFKSYEELKARLESVLDLTPSGAAPLAKASAPAPVKKSVAATIDDEIPFLSDEEEDDDLKAFRALAD